MPLQFTGTLKIISSGQPYIDKKTGETTPAKFTNIFAVQDENGDPKVCTLKSKSDYSRLLDKLVEGYVTLYPMSEGSGFWASLTDLHEAKVE